MHDPESAIKHTNTNKYKMNKVRKFYNNMIKKADKKENVL
jgi:hypothetical protein